MKTKWAKDHNGVDAVEDGCELSEEETKLLIRLAGQLSHGFLLKKGFTSGGYNYSTVVSRNLAMSSSPSPRKQKTSWCHNEATGGREMSGSVFNINLPHGHYPQLGDAIREHVDGSQYIEVVVSLREDENVVGICHAAVGVVDGDRIQQIPQDVIPNYAVPLNENFTLEDLARDAIGAYIRRVL